MSSNPEIPGVLRDVQLAGTPLRGIIKQGDFSLLAYIGLPLEHWAASAENVELRCHRGVTWRGDGDDDGLPAGWHWIGWDYAHLGDRIHLPRAVTDLPEFSPLQVFLNRGKDWPVDEVWEDLLDAAILVLSQIVEAEARINSVTNDAQQAAAVAGAMLGKLGVVPR